MLVLQVTHVTVLQSQSRVGQGGMHQMALVFASSVPRVTGPECTVLHVQRVPVAAILPPAQSQPTIASLGALVPRGRAKSWQGRRFQIVSARHASQA